MSQIKAIDYNISHPLCIRDRFLVKEKLSFSIDLLLYRENKFRLNENFEIKVVYENFIWLKRNQVYSKRLYKR